MKISCFVFIYICVFLLVGISLCVCVSARVCVCIDFPLRFPCTTIDTPHFKLMRLNYCKITLKTHWIPANRIDIPIQLKCLSFPVWVSQTQSSLLMILFQVSTEQKNCHNISNKNPIDIDCCFCFCFFFHTLTREGLVCFWFLRNWMKISPKKPLTIQFSNSVYSKRWIHRRALPYRWFKGKISH